VRAIGRFIRYIVIIAVILYIASLCTVLYFALVKHVPNHADAAIVLGAKVNLDNTPSDPLLNRTTEAVSLFKNGTVSWIMTTGGEGLGYVPESKSARAIALQDGVPISDVLIETESHTTYENIEDIVPIAQANDITSVIIVSDRFHVARGVIVAKFFGFNPVGWDYPATSSYTNKELVINYARESAALIAYMPRLLYEHTRVKTWL
jgi:uncharacterized SAM-binding protein YcdF (DUF218 family)